LKEYKESQKIPLILVLDNVRSLYNVGSVFRTADAFSLQALYLCGITAKPPHREIQKTALGATESVTWTYFNETLEAINRLKRNNYTILAIEQAEHSVMLDSYIPDKNNRYAVVFGHEVKGVQQMVVDLCDECIEIPQYGTKHSLNIAVSAGIVVWDLFQKLKN